MSGLSHSLQRWRHLSRDPHFRQGARDQLQVALGIGAWGLVTGVAMVKAGLSIPMAALMSLLVYAGSSQLAVLPLLASHAPLWVIWLTGFCVNLRFVIFSSMWREHFGHLPLARRLRMMYFSTDMIFVLFFQRFTTRRYAPEQEPYFWGSAVVTWLGWQLPSFAGIFLAQFIPLSWGLGFAGILALLGVTLSLLIDRATLAAGLAAGAVAIAAYAMPLKLNILVAIAAAIVLGLSFEAAERRLRQAQARPRQAATTAAEPPEPIQEQAPIHAQARESHHEL
ncbi:branched-chain amino acid ABC transporter permease [Corticibacter populi]|uniref:Branched-chain amino acid ABC transporter permease n=1 Tax=Corticibacter populi TaxID=1550736 RepID=A0A3M6R126_9BURK|nr:AzlC family ABC transporter permease [Corticibacter populi]RMX08883.1 branched-chain amino acid ABC transporter permease [Corticibacter populi]